MPHPILHLYLFPFTPLKKHLWAGGVMGIMVFFILWVFQPFGTYDFTISYKALFLLGYGLISAFTYMAFYALGFALFPKWFNAERWNLLRELVSLLLVLMLMSLFSLFYHHWFMGRQEVTFIGYLYFLRYCLLVAVVPVSILFYQKWIQQKLGLTIEEQIDINPKEVAFASKMLIFESKNKGEATLTVNTDELVWLKSEGNYVEVALLKGTVLKKQLIRNTLNRVEATCPSEKFIRIHRSYIVNINYARKLVLDSSNYELELNGVDVRLPVSRTLARNLKQLMDKQP